MALRALKALNAISGIVTELRKNAKIPLKVEQCELNFAFSYGQRICQNSQKPEL